jgi:hypothetical protein
MAAPPRPVDFLGTHYVVVLDLERAVGLRPSPDQPGKIQATAMDPGLEGVTATAQGQDAALEAIAPEIEARLLQPQEPPPADPVEVP